MKSADYKEHNYQFKTNINMKTKTSILALTKAFFILLVSSCLLVSCTQEKSTSIDESSENRIKLKEVRIINGYRYSIIEVDSIEYLTQDKGGFVRLSK